MISSGVLYRAAVEAEARITQKMARLRYAQNDVRSRGMAYDANAEDAREVYVSALSQRGISRDELRTLTSYDLEKMLKCMPARGSRSRRSTAMAMDAAPKDDALAGILNGSSTPLDLSDR
jgi:hypothetical protein